MLKCYAPALFRENSRHLVSHSHGAMMPARAPESHGEAVLALLDVARDELPDHLRHPVDELFADIVLQHVMADFLVIASERLQARHVVRIRDEADVDNQSASIGIPCL